MKPLKNYETYETIVSIYKEVKMKAFKGEKN